MINALDEDNGYFYIGFSLVDETGPPFMIVRYEIEDLLIDATYAYEW